MGLNKFTLPDSEMNRIVDSLDETSGILIKESELKYWIEYFVNQNIDIVHHSLDANFERQSCGCILHVGTGRYVRHCDETRKPKGN